MSLRSSERGLKLTRITANVERLCRSVRRSVDWNYKDRRDYTYHKSRSVRRSVDWNISAEQLKNVEQVAPFVGAWIEIAIGGKASYSLESLRSSERGLKCLGGITYTSRMSRSVRRSVDWNITNWWNQRKRYCRSVRRSVDWNGQIRIYTCKRCVAPFVGAWIEIKWLWGYMYDSKSRSVRRSVDWNCLVDDIRGEYEVAPFVGAWIEITVMGTVLDTIAVAPFVGAWIEIFSSGFKGPEWAFVAPFVGAWIEIL